MTVTTTTYREDVAYVPRAGTLYDVIDIILDRGMVIDVFARVSLVGIEILKVDIRVVIASVDTYLRFAEACNRLDLETDQRSRTVPELFGATGQSVARGVTKKGVKQVAKRTGEKAKKALTGHEKRAKDRGQDREQAKEKTEEATAERERGAEER